MSESSDPQGPEELRAEIEQTREELARTVDALGAKLDVKGRAADKVDDARAQLGDAASRAKHAAPAPVADALDRAAPPLHQAAEAVRPYRSQLVLGVVAAAVVALVIRRRSRR